MVRFAGRAALVVVSGAVLAWIGVQVWRTTVGAELPHPPDPLPLALQAQLDEARIALFERAAPSVVYLYAEPVGAEPGDGGAGSGIVWDREGHIVTNYHVIEGVKRVRVRLDTGETLQGVVVGGAPDYDLAVVKLIDLPRPLEPLPRGRSFDLRVGQSVYAIGNPFGLSRTLTTGVVSARDRRLPTSTGREVTGAIQIDAAINPGNSGGPLLDSTGRLIGVTAAIVSPSGGSAGIGFAVPVDTVARVVPLLIRDGRIPRPGIGIIPLPEEEAARRGYEGVVVADVHPGSPAAQAGLRGGDRFVKLAGDIIVAAAGRKVATVGAFVEVLEQAGIGQRISLIVERDGHRRQVELTIVDVGG